MLPGTPKNRVVAVGARYGQLPASPQNGMTYAFGADITKKWGHTKKWGQVL